MTDEERMAIVERPRAREDLHAMKGRKSRQRAVAPRRPSVAVDQGSIDFAARRFVDLCQEYLERFDPQTRGRILERVREITSTRSWSAP
jgi:hypothetical protein